MSELESVNILLDLLPHHVSETRDAIRAVVGREVRAGQVAILREMADELATMAREGSERADRLDEPEAAERVGHESVGLADAAEHLRDKANQLKASGGQTGERDA